MRGSLARRAGTLGLAAAMAASGAGAATGVSTQADSTWGTTPAGDRAGRVLAVVEAGPVVFLAGEFTGVLPPGGDRATAVPRPYLAAFDVRGGALTSFDARVNGPVRALALSPDGQRLYLGGEFTTVGGHPVQNLAAVSPATGAFDSSFAPSRLNSGVRALAVSGDRLYAGGDFLQVSAPDGQVQDRPQLAAFDLAGGALLDWIPPANAGGEFYGQTGQERAAGDGAVFDLAVSGDGTAVYAAGSFLDFGGQGGLLAVDAGSGEPTDWQADVGRPVFALDISPADGHTLFAAMGGPGGLLAAFDPGRGRDPLWQVRTDGDNVGVVASADTVYLLGHYDYVVSAGSDCYQRCPGGPERHHLAAFDAGSGTLDPWNPTADTSTGPYTGAIGRDHLYVGGEFTQVNGRAQPGFARFTGRP